MDHDPTPDERLARLAARSQARRDELAHAVARTDAVGDRREPHRSPTRRRHAANGSRGAALALSAVSTLGLAAWFHQATTTDAAGASTSESASSSTSDTVGASTSSARSAGSSTTTTTTGTSTTSSGTGTSTSAASTSDLADGTYTGASASTRWGPVQVQITVAGGKITSVDVVDYPADDRKSASINARAIPTLTQQTLSTQTAKVTSVSGATYTSTGYRTSLQSAIDAATAASAS
jgi:uncharacterized protein with FMN-binding domain